MMRGYFSLAIPVCLTAIAAITWMQIRHANPALARAGELQLAQAQPGVDPFAPQPPAVQPNPAQPNAAQPNPALPPAARPTVPGKRRPQAEVPQNKDEVKTPLLRSLLDSLDEMQEGTDEEKDGLRQMLYEADVELRHSLGSNMRKTIRDANNPKHKVFEVKPQASRFPPKPKGKPQRVPQPAPRPTPPATPSENVDPAPAPPEKPAPNAVDDLFKEPADNANE